MDMHLHRIVRELYSQVRAAKTNKSCVGTLVMILPGFGVHYDEPSSRPRESVRYMLALKMS